MPLLEVILAQNIVALLAEGVDRNKNLKLSVNEALGRPPRGGRG